MTFRLRRYVVIATEPVHLLQIRPIVFNILAEMVMRETLDGFHGGLQIGGRMTTNLRYADDIILLAASEAELRELVGGLDRVCSRQVLQPINIDKTKVMASDGIVCRILIQNELLAQVNTVPIPWVSDYGRW